jgi:hypothetical protein
LEWNIWVDGYKLLIVVEIVHIHTDPLPGFIGQALDPVRA